LRRSGYINGGFMVANRKIIERYLAGKPDRFFESEPMEEIAAGVEKLQPVRHHLQLTAGEINVLDDSRNTRMEAGVEALRILSELPGRRIVVTKGFLDHETGAAAKNFAFGTQIARFADYVVLIDPEKTLSVMEGLMSKRFPKPSVRMVREVEDAAALIDEIAEAGDTVLYECTWDEVYY